MPNRVCHVILLRLGEAPLPIPEFIGELDLPRHTCSIPYYGHRSLSALHHALRISSPRRATPATPAAGHSTRRNRDPLKTNPQRQSQSRIPAAAALYWHRAASVFHTQPFRRATDSPVAL